MYKIVKTESVSSSLGREMIGGIGQGRKKLFYEFASLRITETSYIKSRSLFRENAAKLLGKF
ncbi:hypothetical protein BK126_25435 [Paenibacillus sp. FSL H7-0326]|uniref:hypothetical protein n=1 Tax=Paenibacillus sp. FSL H7-0326 TaxID=1921144 RepID=UPI00096FD1A0|nr:hypothetical protein BK126_25435 [Paenibacillus sp. FSL H7-0326]